MVDLPRRASAVDGRPGVRHAHGAARPRASPPARRSSSPWRVPRRRAPTASGSVPSSEPRWSRRLGHRLPGRRGAGLPRGAHRQVRPGLVRPPGGRREHPGALHRRRAPRTNSSPVTCPRTPTQELQRAAGRPAGAAGGLQRRTPRTLLDHMSTADVAADLDVLREALGDEQLTYLGYSYGTSIGSVYATLFPDNVRALVLDGSVSPSATEEQQLLAQAQGFERTLRQLRRGVRRRPRLRDRPGRRCVDRDRACPAVQRPGRGRHRCGRTGAGSRPVRPGDRDGPLRHDAVGNARRIHRRHRRRRGLDPAVPRRPPDGPPARRHATTTPRTRRRWSRAPTARSDRRSTRRPLLRTGSTAAAPTFGGITGVRHLGLPRLARRCRAAPGHHGQGCPDHPGRRDGR